MAAARSASSPRPQSRGTHARVGCRFFSSRRAGGTRAVNQFNDRAIHRDVAWPRVHWPCDGRDGDHVVLEPVTASARAVRTGCYHDCDARYRDRDQPGSQGRGSDSGDRRGTSPFGILRSAAVLERYYNQLVMRQGITIQQYDVLRILRDAGADGLPTLMIRDRMVHEAPGITRLVDKRSNMRASRSAAGTLRIERQVVCHIAPERMPTPRGAGRGRSRRGCRRRVSCSATRSSASSCGCCISCAPGAVPTGGPEAGNLSLVCSLDEMCAIECSHSTTYRGWDMGRRHEVLGVALLVGVMSCASGDSKNASGITSTNGGESARRAGPAAPVRPARAA